MAFNDKEFELKFRLTDQQFCGVLKILERDGKASRVSTQRDTYLVPRNDNWLSEEFPYQWLSIRNRNNKNILNYKHFHPEGVERHLYCDEHEVVVESEDQMVRLLEALEFVVSVVVEKTRSVFSHLEGVEISLDTVKELGCFIEIEATRDYGGIDKTRDRLHAVAKELGVASCQPDYRGYPFLIYAEKKGDR